MAHNQCKRVNFLPSLYPIKLAMPRNFGPTKQLFLLYMGENYVFATLRMKFFVNVICYLTILLKIIF
jgi:hypothetical protein